MNDRCLSLQPHPSTPFPPSFKLWATIGLRSNSIAIRYSLHGPLSELVIPSPAEEPVRMNGLWEETCFEFFLTAGDSPRYWEFNLSPAGHWNAYRFSGYRQGMQEETAFTSLPFDVQTRSDSLLIYLKLDLERITPGSKALDLGVSAVIKHRDGVTTYWALNHGGPHADFHRRETFIVAFQR